MIEGLKPYAEHRESGQKWLGRLPSDWNVLPLCRVASVKSVCGYPDLELLSVYLHRGVIRYSESGGQVHKPSLDLSKYQLVEPGDFVLNNQQAWRGSIGVSSVSQDETSESVTSQSELNVKPSAIKAWQAFQHVEANWPAAEGRLTVRKAWEWLKENGPDEYVLPSFDSFERYVRAARNATGQQVNRPRCGRSGRSIVKQRGFSP